MDLTYDIPAKHKKLIKSESDYINRERDEDIFEIKESISYRKLIGYKQTWAYMVGRALSDPIWWFLLFWVPSFLKNEYGMTDTQVSFPSAIVYTLATFGSIGGGWLSGFLLN